jgi:hypothetical protein
MGLAAGVRGYRRGGDAARGLRAKRGGERAFRAAPVPARIRHARLAAGHAPGAGRGGVAGRAAGASGFGAAAQAGDAAELRRLVRDEGTAVLDIAGFDYSSAAELADVRRDSIRIEPVNGSARAGGSSWQSLTRQTGTIEANFLNGEIVLLGRQYDVPTPVNEALQRLANQAARERMPPGSMTPAQILAAAGVAEGPGGTPVRSG